MENTPQINFHFTIQRFSSKYIRALSVAVENKSNCTQPLKEVGGLACIIDRRFLRQIIEECDGDIKTVNETVFDIFIQETSTAIITYYNIMPIEEVDDMLLQVEKFVDDTVRYWSSQS